MTRAAIRAVSCPSCGGAAMIRADRESGPCASCGTACALVDSPAPRRVGIVPHVSASEAGSIVRDALAHSPADDRVRRFEGVSFEPAALVYAPFLEIEAIRAGTVVRNCGARKVRGGTVDWSTGARRFLDDQGNEIGEQAYYARRTVPVTDTIVILAQHRSVEPVGGPAEWRLTGAGVGAMLEQDDVEVVPFGAGDAARSGAAVLAPTTAAAVEGSLRQFAGSAESADIELVSPQVRLVFLPVWVVRWKLGTHPHVFAVDAVRGKVLHGTAPEGRRRSAGYAVAACATTGVFFFGAIELCSGMGRYAGNDADDVLFMFLLLAFLLVTLLAFAWGEFRYRGEVVFRPDGPEVIKPDRPTETGFDRFAARLGEFLADWMKQG